jgi:hypothetical protein
MTDHTILDCLRGEFLEMPGLRLTLRQAQRLWGLDANRSRTLLDSLVAERFLRVTNDGSYLRASEGVVVAPP